MIDTTTITEYKYEAERILNRHYPEGDIRNEGVLIPPQYVITMADVYAEYLINEKFLDEIQTENFRLEDKVRELENEITYGRRS